MIQSRQQKKHDLPLLVDLPRRPRRNRATPAVRDLVRETRLSPADFILPVFLIDGENREDPIASMPGIARQSADRIVETARQIEGPARAPSRGLFSARRDLSSRRRR